MIFFFQKIFKKQKAYTQVPLAMHGELTKKRIKNGAGYTLVELIIVFSIISFLAVMGIASFLKYNDIKALETTASDIGSMFNTAKSRVQSQVKPAGCSSNFPLNRYEIRICSGITTPPPASCPGVTGTPNFALYAICNNDEANPYLAAGENQKKLPQNITILSSTANIFSFEVLTGQATSGNIVFKNNKNATETITVGSNGTITVN